MKPSEQPTPSRSVLIVAGRNLIPTYNEPRAEQIWFEFSSSFSEARREELARAGIPVQLHINRDRAAPVADEVARLLGQQSHGGLIQVAVDHVKSGSENTVYLTVQYFRLRYTSESGKRNVTTGDGPRKRYPILRASGEDMRDVSASRLAEDFARELRATGVM